MYVYRSFGQADKQVAACKYFCTVDMLDGGNESRPRPCGVDHDYADDDDSAATSVVTRPTAVSESGTVLASVTQHAPLLEISFPSVCLSATHVNCE